MPDKLSELKQKKVALIAEARKLLETAEKEERSITDEEHSKYTEITSQIDDLEATISVTSDLQERQRGLAREEGGKEERTEPSGYSKVFDKYLRRGMEDLSGDERAILRAGYQREARAPGDNMNVTAPGDGGYTVPDDFSRQLVEKLEEQSGVMGAGATVLNTSGGNPILIPKVTVHSAPAGVVTELDPVVEQVDTFDQVPLGSFKYPALIKVSVELLQDSAVDIEAYLASELGRKIGRAAGDAYAVGTGGGAEPTGIMTAGSPQNTASSTDLAVDEFIDLIYAVTPPYRRGAAFLMHDNTVGALRKMKWNIGADPVGYAWQPSMQAGTPDRLFGYPIYTDPAIEDTLAAGNLVAAFGDISRFYIRLAGGVSFVRLNERYLADDQTIGFLAWVRTDSDLVDDNAIAVMRMKP